MRTPDLNDGRSPQDEATADRRVVARSSAVEGALRQLLLSQTGGSQTARSPLSAWELGEPLVDIYDNRVLREMLDSPRRLAGLSSSA